MQVSSIFPEHRRWFKCVNYACVQFDCYYNATIRPEGITYPWRVRIEG